MAINIKGIKNFIRKRPKIFILSAAIVVFCILLIAVVSLASSARTAKPANTAVHTTSPIPPEELFLPGEPLPTPGIQLSRETKPSWSEEEAAHWFIPTSKDDLDELRLAGEESVTRLLEQVP